MENSIIKETDLLDQVEAKAFGQLKTIEKLLKVIDNKNSKLKQKDEKIVKLEAYIYAKDTQKIYPPASAFSWKDDKLLD